ncbi:MAG: TlpA disulfide reductase family protein [Gemmataceae bacterium]
MRLIAMTGLCLLGLTACSAADDKNGSALAQATGKEQEKKPEVKVLKVGDPAPLIQGAKYLTGSEITSYAAGKVYVVEFWATWCGPCIQAMPHLASLQREYKDKGLVIVGVTTKDPNNTAEKVAEFVEKKGKKLGYSFAYCETEATSDAFMKAAGQDGIPCSFVVDKAGKIAYIGHPMELDDVLDKVVAGTWRGQADLDEISKANDEFNAIMATGQKDPAGTLKKLDEYGVKYPSRAKQEIFKVRKLVLMMMSKQFDEAKKVSETMLKAAQTNGDVSSLVNIAAIWSADQLNPEKKEIALAISAVESFIKIEGDKDLSAVVTAAEIYFACGKKDLAVEYGNKALAMAENPQQKAAFEDMLKKFKGDKK